jgi:hypothetical protein
MTFIKKYAVLLIPAGIVLAAVIFIALTVLTNRSLAANIQEESVAADGQIKRLLPDAVPVNQWEEEKKVQDALEQEAADVVELAKQCSMRELISYGIFPKPTDESQQVFDVYAARYRAALEQLIRGMNAMEAPSEMEIRSEIGESTAGAASYSAYGAASSSTRYPSTVAGTSRTQTDTARQAMIDAVCARRAEQIAVYANPTVFDWYDYWANWKFSGKDQALLDCWHAQVAFWIYEDVVATINALNAGSPNVYASPVKRLLGVTFTYEADYPKPRTSAAYYDSTGRAGRGAYGGVAYGSSGTRLPGDAPEYIRFPSGGQLGVVPWTARISNDDIDVVHFSVGVITASSAVMPFMKELCRAKPHTWRAGYKENGAQQNGIHNQITILSSEVRPVSLAAPENASYRYGNEAVVRLNLVCEYVFNRAGYDEIKPDKVKEYLGQLKTDGQTPAGGAPGPSRMPAPTRRREPARGVGADEF